MAKPKSLKLRTLVTLHALWKHSDKDHRMNTVKLNEYLRPYNVGCTTSRVLNDTVRMLREFGFDVRNKGEWDNQGIWIENRPLPDHELKRLIFAVTTNPHLSKDQATEILQSLKPFVTVYQENLLQGVVDAEPMLEPDDALYWAYAVIQEAITSGRRVRYNIEYIQYDKETQSVAKRQEWATLFTPKCIYQTKGDLYMVGYNNTDRRVETVNLKDIASIKLAFKHTDPKAAEVNHWIAGIVPADVVLGECQEIIYDGPATFLCRGQYVGELYRRFGPPDGPVVKDVRCRTSYKVARATMTSKDLYWLSQVPDHDIRLVGPEELVEAVRSYYDGLAKWLTNPVLPANKQNRNRSEQRKGGNHEQKS